MDRTSQLGVIISAFGGVLTFIGLFPGVVGLDNAAGVGFFQIVVILFGFSVLTLGAYIYVQTTYYPNAPHNFPQQVGLRLSLTGIIIAIACGLADTLGFGSNPFIGDQRGVFGNFQFAGLLGGFIIASIGVLVFALMGDPNQPNQTNQSSQANLQ